MMRKFAVPALLGGSLLAAAAPASAGNGTPLNPNSNDVLTLAVYGDAPYGLNPTDTSETLATPAFVDNINADPKVDLVLHVGDIHSGKQFCTENYDRTVYDLWQAYKNPVIYTPGDNEWTDCNKIGEGGGLYNATTHQIDYALDAGGNAIDYAKGNPVDNLTLIRSIFFSQPGYSLGGRSKQVLSQAKDFDPAYPSDAQYVENVIWEQSKVVFVAINLPGGSNDDADVWYAAPKANITPAQVTEAAQRKAADLRWLDRAFQIATSDGAQAVLIMAQADMWDVTDAKGVAHAANYEPYVKKIADSTLAFGKPVLMFNGDSHVYQSGNPFSPTDPVYSWHPGYNVPNFHRVVVHGSTFPLEWLKVTVAPGTNAPQGQDAFGPFSWTRQIMP
jgi:hypothetical protein